MILAILLSVITFEVQQIQTFDYAEFRAKNKKGKGTGEWARATPYQHHPYGSEVREVSEERWVVFASFSTEDSAKTSARSVSTENGRVSRVVRVQRDDVVFFQPCASVSEPYTPKPKRVVDVELSPQTALVKGSWYSRILSRWFDGSDTLLIVEPVPR